MSGYRLENVRTPAVVSLAIDRQLVWPQVQLNIQTLQILFSHNTRIKTTSGFCQAELIVVFTVQEVRIGRLSSATSGRYSESLSESDEAVNFSRRLEMTELEAKQQC